jgi:FixJ family two-component response regulator
VRSLRSADGPLGVGLHQPQQRPGQYGKRPSGDAAKATERTLSAFMTRAHTQLVLPMDSNKEIAASLDIAESTAKWYVLNSSASSRSRTACRP